MTSQTTPEIINLTLGTAGHIDHGKTSLVQKLTGVNTDSLPEEKARGLTINIGFASCKVGENRVVGIVDVPGHEKFVKNMVAGVSGIDAVMLVVAADDSIMPQTREHLAIVQLLGINKGLIVLTKVDLVDEEYLELVQEDIRDFVKGTFLEKAPICPLSSVTGRGFDDFKKTFDAFVRELKPKSVEGRFRIPIDRVFTLQGHGTIVTGTPGAGKVTVGDTLELLPGGKKARVRSIQTFGKDSQSSFCGQRTALNIPDIDYKEIHRGMVLAEPGFLRESNLVDARLTLLENAGTALKTDSKVHFHSGTSEVFARVVLLDRKFLGPGEDALVQFHLQESIVIGPKDHYVIRSESPVHTIGGGNIIGPDDKILRRNKQWVLDSLAQREKALDDPEKLLEFLAHSRQQKPVSREVLLSESGLSTDSGSAHLEALRARGTLCQISQKGLFIHAEFFDRALNQIQKNLEKFHERNPFLEGVGRFEQRDAIAMDHDLFDAVIEMLGTKGIVSDTGGILKLSKHKVNLSSGQMHDMAEIERLFLENLFQPPTEDELADRLKMDPKKIGPLLNLMRQRKMLVQASPEFHFHIKAIEAAKEKLREYFRENKELLVSAFRDLVGTSRKYAYAIMEYLDNSQFTRRVGNSRFLKEKS